MRKYSKDDILKATYFAVLYTCLFTVITFFLYIFTKIVSGTMMIESYSVNLLILLFLLLVYKLIAILFPSADKQRHPLTEGTLQTIKICMILDRIATISGILIVACCIYLAITLF